MRYGAGLHQGDQLHGTLPISSTLMKKWRTSEYEQVSNIACVVRTAPSNTSMRPEVRHRVMIDGLHGWT